MSHRVCHTGCVTQGVSERVCQRGCVRDGVSHRVRHTGCVSEGVAHIIGVQSHKTCELIATLLAHVAILQHVF